MVGIFVVILVVKYYAMFAIGIVDFLASVVSVAVVVFLLWLRLLLLWLLLL